MLKSRFILSVFRLAMVLVLLAGCIGQTTPKPAPAPTLTSTPRPTPLPSPTANPAAGLIKQAGPLPPLALPAGGSGMIAKDGLVEVRFSQPMDANSTTAAFHFKDASGAVVQGKVSWPAPDRLQFKPDKALDPGGAYQAVISEGAKDAHGVTLRDAAAIDFQVTGAIRVSQVFPANNTQDVAPKSAITVLFDRPVAPLRIAEEQTKLPDPLKIDPPVEGKGDWVNTSVYVFRPTSTLKSSTTYHVTVPAGLADGTGASSAPLAEDYAWTFQTMPPGVKDLELLPVGDETQSIAVAENQPYENAPLDLALRLTFMQPMDEGSTFAATSLVPHDVNSGADGAPVKLTATWSADHQQLDLKPEGRLALGTDYLLKVSPDARAADGGSLDHPVTWAFYTVRPPAINDTDPKDGGQISSWGAFSIQFASPMNIKSVTDHVTFDPPLQKTSVDNWYYDPYSFNFTFYGLEPATAYTVTITPGMADIYGNTIDESRTVHFTTSGLDPQVSFTGSTDVLWRGGTPGDFYLRLANVKSATVSLYRLSIDEVMAANDWSKGQGLWGLSPANDSLVWQQKISPDLPPDKAKLVKVTVGPDFNPETGFYLMTLESPDVNTSGRRFADMRMVTISSSSPTLKVSPSDALVWMTDLATGRPVANVKVTIYRTSTAQAVGSGDTDVNGLLKLNIDQSTPTSYIAVAEQPGNPDFGYANSQWGSGVYPGDFGIGESYYGAPQPVVGYVYTERPIYRPGQTVYFKGILRKDDDMNYALPDTKTVTVWISSFDKKIFDVELPVSDYGTFSGSFPLDNAAELGSYNLSVFAKPSADIVTNSPTGQNDNPVAGLSFSVAEYRRPEFQVNIVAAPTNVLAGDSFSANLKAEYYSGGGVANATVEWTLRAVPFSFTPPDAYSRYRFDDVDRDLLGPTNAPAETDNLLAQGTAQTDAQGQLTLTIPAKIQKDVSQTLVFEATVTDIAGAAVSNRVEVVAHRSQIYPGLRFADYIGQEGKEARIDLVALDWDGKPVANQKVTIEVVERRWHSVQEQSGSGAVHWTSSVEDIPVKTFTDVTLDQDGKGSVSFTPPNGGVFRARVTAADSHDRSGAASDYLWVAGKDYIPWRQGDDRSFQLVLDRENYKPGDTAQILIASPFQGQNYALVTVERGRIRKQDVVLLENNSTVYALPITPDMAPNAYISVMVVKGIDATNPYPDFRVGMAELKVSTDKQAIKVEVTPDKTSAGPGDQVTYTIKTSDSDGKPVSAEVGVGVSDLATLSLAYPNTGPVLDGFYNRRGLSVATGISIINSLEATNASLADQMEPQGKGMGSGGGKGVGEMGVFEIRQDFPDTAFWKPDVRTGDNGQATVTVKLPDNLTIWRLDARAMTLDTRLGQTTLDLRSTKPLLVRPQTPRFFVEGDAVTVGTAVHNNSDQNLSVQVTLQVENLELQSPAEQTVPIDAGKQAYVSWQVTVPAGANLAQLTFSAKGGPFMDASRPTIGNAGIEGLPVYRYEAPETVSTSGQMGEGGARAEAILLPEGMDVTQGQLDVSVSPSLSASLTDGLNYLKNYAYESTEETISRFLPNVAIARVLREAGAPDAQMESGLKDQINLSFQKLASWQNDDGGWGYWQGGLSDNLVTAYVVLGLQEAKAAGYDVPQTVLDNAVVYLRNHIRATSSWYDQTVVDNRSAFVLYVLARAGEPQPSEFNLLYDRRNNLQLYARSFLTQAMWLADAQDPRIATLRSDFNNAAVLSASGTHWEETYADRWNWNSDTRTTAIVLDTITRMDAKDPLTGNAVRWLMAHRTNGRWAGTQETAWTLLALADWMSASGDLKANYQFAVGMNGAPIGQGDANAQTLNQTWTTTVQVKDLLKDAANSLVFARTAGSGNLYYTANLKVWLPVKDVQALDRGVIISRSYTLLDNPDTPVTSAKLGDLLRVRITITAPAGLHYLLVEDPLPAGLEAVDTNLLSSPQAQAPQQYSSNDWDKEGWGWWYFNHAEMRDEKVVLSADYLPAGTYVYTYVVRASTQGVFNVIPTTASEFYFPDVYGRGDGMVFEVK